MIQKMRINWLALTVSAVFIFLYIPIIVLVLFSFNNGAFPLMWKGFTFEWYRELWRSVEVWVAIYTSLYVALASMLLSIVIGLMFVVAGYMCKWADYSVSLFYACLAVPDIVIAVSVLSALSLFAIMPGINLLIVMHTLLGLSYAVPILYNTFKELDRSL
ncbi:MAG: hypothetical protein WBQ73_03600, partial [Candidatus Babeliales bacterium]